MGQLHCALLSVSHHAHPTAATPEFYVTLGAASHRTKRLGRHNLTLMFNAIETSDRLKEDAVEHGNVVPPQTKHTDEKVAHM